MRGRPGYRGRHCSKHVRLRVRGRLAVVENEVSRLRVLLRGWGQCVYVGCVLK